MSGETKRAESGWTVDTLKEYVERRFIDTDKALDAATESLKEYKSGSNEWRDTVKDLVTRMPSRAELETLSRSISDKLDKQAQDIRELREARSSSVASGMERRAVVDTGRANIATFIGIVMFLVAVYGWLRK